MLLNMKRKFKFQDKDAVVIISLIVSMAFLWLQINNVFTKLDLYILVWGTMIILVAPNLIYYINSRYNRKL